MVCYKPVASGSRLVAWRSIGRSTGHNRIEECIGSSTELTSDEVDDLNIGTLLGKRVQVEGIANRDDKGRIKDVKATRLI